MKFAIDGSLKSIAFFFNLTEPTPSTNSLLSLTSENPGKGDKSSFPLIRISLQGEERGTEIYTVTEEHMGIRTFLF